MPVQAELEARPLLYGNFMTFQEDTPIYDTIPNYDILRKTLDAKLAEYNESNPAMDLVLFQQVLLPLDTMGPWSNGKKEYMSNPTAAAC